MGLRLVPSSVTLNDLERRIIDLSSVISPNSIALQADYVTVVEDRPLMSPKISSPGYIWPKLTHPAARCLCDSWGTCWLCCHIQPLFFGYPKTSCIMHILCYNKKTWF